MKQSLALHAAVLALLVILFFTLPAYHHGQVARIMVLAVYAMGYNILFGYAGLLSLGHALFFAAGMYGMGLAAQHGGATLVPAVLAGLAATLVVAAIAGALALRTTGVAFMIVTLMFAQTGYLAVLYFGEYTRGDEGFVLVASAREIAGVALSGADARYIAALGVFTVALLAKLWLVHSPAGHVLIAIRENEARAEMLGYNTYAYKFLAVILSAVFAGAAGATYGILFGYVGASFAEVPYSIFPLLWVLLGGAGTVLGPVVGTGFMLYLIDYTSGLTDAYMLIVGVALVVLVLFARKGLLGLVRQKFAPWLP